MSIGKISSQSAKNYYYEKDPIFNENGEGNNLEWHGKQAEILGLENGEVNQKEFENLLKGMTPEGDTQLLNREKTIVNGEENAVFDMPLSAPKSVSIVALGEDGDKRLIEAHDKAVEATIKYLEDNYAKTRGYVEQEDGTKKRETYDTDNLLVATAKHSTARPTANDPEPNAHLHTHTLVFNQTYDKKTDSFKALDTRQMFKDQKDINQVYLSNLAKNVKELGYGIEDNGKGSFNLKGVSEEVIDKFSSRRNEVNEQMEAMGATSEKDRAYIGQTLKADKVEMSSKDLKESWDRKLEEVGTSVKELKENAKEEFAEKNFESAKEVLETTMQHLTQNESYVTEKELIKAASQVSVGEFSTDELKKELDNVKKIGQKEGSELKNLGENEKGEKIFTNKETFEIEKENKKLSKELGSNNNGSIMSKEQAEAGIKDFEDKNFKLTKGQKEAAIGILTSKESVVAIQGDAGTGKSTMLAAVNHTLEFNNNKAKVSVAAPTNKAVSGAVEASKTENGKSFEGMTVHKVVHGKNNGKELNEFEKQANNEKVIEKVKDISSKFEDINIATGNKAFDKAKSFSLNPSNSLNVKLKGLETSWKDVKRSGNNMTVSKQSKINAGEYKGSIKKERTTVNKSGSHIKYEKEIKLNNGEKYKQKIETYNPLNLGGKSGSPLNKFSQSLMGSHKKIVENANSKQIESKKSLAGLSVERKMVIGKNADQSKTSLKVLGGLAKVEHNIISQRFKNGGAKDIDTKQAGLLGVKVKVATETTFDKEGNITGKTTTKEKSFMGITFGKTTNINKSGELKEVEYKKIGSKIKEESIKITKEEKVDIKDKFESEKIDLKLENKAKITKADKLLIIDESSMLSSKDVNTILKSAKEEGLNVVFMGDDKQLASIGAGNAFREVKENVKNFEMKEGQRQRTEEQKGITNAAAAREIKQSLENLDKAGGLKEIKSEDKRIEAMVKNIVKEEKVEITNMKGQKEIVNIDYKNTAGLAATNEENKAINKGVRKELKSKGKITDEVHNVKVNVNVSMNAIKQSSAANFEKDMKLTTFTGAKGMKQTVEYKVVDIDKSKNTLKLKSVEPNKKTGNYDFTTVKTKDIAGKVTIKKEEDRSFGIGDKVVVTETNKKAGVVNSDAGLIVEMDKKNKTATIDFGEAGKKQIDLKEFKGLEHGYSTTNHKAQGISVDRVVATIDTTKNKVMNSLQSYYVAMSRQKSTSTLITDDKKNLEKQVSKEVINRSSQEDFQKKGEIEIKQNVSDSLKKDISELKNNSEKREGRRIEPSLAFDKAKDIANERDNARNNNNVEQYKEKQSEFMNMQVVARNGYSSEKVEEFSNKQVESGKMTQEQAIQFIKNSNENAKSLSEIGILEDKGNGNYTFTDSKSKEILFDNADKNHEEIGKINLEAYKENSKEVDLISEKSEKIEFKSEEKSEEIKLDKKDSLNDLDKTLEKIEANQEKPNEKIEEKPNENGEINTEKVSKSR